MKICVIYDSVTGNTKMLADRIQEKYRDRLTDRMEEADVIFLGSWTDKGSMASNMLEFVKGLYGKRVALFGTAGFGGSPEYFERILGNVRKHLSDSVEYLGGAMCQGKMGAGVRARYESMLAKNPEDKRAQAMIDNFDAALSHPDADDVEGIVAAAREALGL